MSALTSIGARKLFHDEKKKQKEEKKKKGNKEPKTETTDGKSPAMETDEAPIPPSNSDTNVNTNQQGQVNGAPGPQLSTSEAQPPQQAANPFLNNK